MKNGFKILDAEPHIMEPFELWEQRLPEPYRSRTKISRPPGGHLQQGGHSVEVAGNSDSGSRVSSPVLQQSLRRIPTVAPLAKVLADPNPEAFLEGFDIEGIDVGVLMPTLAMGLLRQDDLDPNHALELCRVFNDYAAEFCQPDPERLKFWAWLPPHDAELAAEEAQRSMEDLGATGVAMTKGAVNGHLLSDEFFEPLWEELDRLHAAFGLHGGSGRTRIADDIRKRYQGHSRASFIAPPGSGFYAHTSMTELVFGGVLERFPHMKPVFMESGCSWLPWLLYEMDGRWETFGPDADFTLSLQPSEYVRRQCYLVAAPGEPGIKYVIDCIGDDNLLISTDFPHHDSLFPEAIDTFLALDGIGDESRRKILWDNGARLFGLGADGDR